jgi:hypothetical protein
MHIPQSMLLLLLLGAGCSAVKSQSTDSVVDPEIGFQSLFNGRDLTGWKRVNTAPSTWTVVDGMLHCDGKPTGELRTTRMYQNFIFEVEWRHLVPAGNAGIFVWADDITARGVPFHRSVEVQVLDHGYGNTNSHTTHGDIFPIHGARMTPVNGRGGSRAFPTESRSNPSPQWNHYSIHCNAGSITLAVNGKVVTRGNLCSPSKGYICLESEGGQVDYRNMRIKVLPDTPVDDADVAQAEQGFETLYSGVDLSGWVLTPQDRDRLHVRDWVLRAEAGESPLTLATERTFESYEFLFDLKLGGERTTINLLPHGSRGPNLHLDSAAEPLASALAAGWNRLRGTYGDGRLELAVNGVPFAIEILAGTRQRGPLRLEIGGVVDLANLYARDLD